MGIRSVETEVSTAGEGERSRAEVTGRLDAIAEMQRAGVDEDPAEERARITREPRRTRADLTQISRAGEDARELEVIRAIDAEDGRRASVGDLHRTAARRQAAGAEFDDAFLDHESTDVEALGPEGHRARADLGNLQGTRRIEGGVVDEGTAESEVGGAAERQDLLAGERIRDEATAGEPRQGQVEAIDVESGAGGYLDGGDGRDRARRGDPQHATGHVDAVAVEVIDGAEHEHAGTGLGQRDAAAGVHRGGDRSADRGRDRRAQDADAAVGVAESETERTAEAEVVGGDVAAEVEVGVHRHGVTDDTREAVAQEEAAVDVQRTGAERTGVRVRAVVLDPIGGHEHATLVQVEVHAEEILAGQRQDTGSGFRQRHHGRGLADDRADDQAGLGEAGLDGDDRIGGREPELGVESVTRDDLRRGRQAVVRRRDRRGAGELRDAERRDGGRDDARTAEIEGGRVRAAIVDEGQAAERLREDIGDARRTEGVVRQGQAAAAVDGHGRARLDLLEDAGGHGHGGVVDGQAAGGGDRIPTEEGTDGLAALVPAGGVGRIDGQRDVGVDGRDPGTRGEVAVGDRHADRETGRVRHRDSGPVRGGDRDAAAGDARGRVQVERAGVDEGPAGVVVVDELRGELQRGATEAHERGRAGDPGTQGEGVLVDEDVEGRTRRADGIVRVDRLEGNRLIGVGHDADPEFVGRAADRRDVLGAAGRHAQGIQRLDAGAQGTARAVVVIQGARQVGDRADISAAGERGRIAPAAAHGDDAELVRVSREGVTVRDGPAADEPVDQAAGVEGDAIHLREVKVGRIAQALAAQRIDAARILGRPTVEVEGGEVRPRALEVTDVQAHGRAGISVRLEVDQVASARGGDRVERDDGVRRATAGEDERAAPEGQGVVGLDARRRRVAGRIETVVIPVDGAVEDLEAGRAGERARVAELEGAAADDGLADISLRARQERGAAARARERQIAGQAAAETTGGGGGQAHHRPGGGVGHGAARARQEIDRAEGTDGLILTHQVDQGIGRVDEERGQTGRTWQGGDGESIREAGVEEQLATVDGDDRLEQVGARTGGGHAFAAGDADAGRADDLRDERAARDAGSGHQGADRNPRGRVDREFVRFLDGETVTKAERSEVGPAIEVESSGTGLDEAGGVADADRCVQIKRAGAKYVEIGGAFGRQRAGSQGRGRAGRDEDGGRAGQAEVEETAPGTIGAEDRRIQGRGQRAGADRGGQRVHPQVGAESQGAGQAEVFLDLQLSEIRLELEGGEGAERAGDAVHDQEARA